MCEDSLSIQTSRLIDAGCPKRLLSSVADNLPKRTKKTGNCEVEVPRRDKKRQYLILSPYIRCNLAYLEIGRWAGVDIAFSAPNRLTSLCQQVNKGANIAPCGTKQHRQTFVSFRENVVYFIPLSWKINVYILDKLHRIGTCKRARRC